MDDPVGPRRPVPDDTSTPEKEARDATVAAALTAAATELTDRFGSDPADWSWGQMHTLEVVAYPAAHRGSGARVALQPWTSRLGGGKGIVNAVGWDAAVTCVGEDADEPESQTRLRATGLPRKLDPQLPPRVGPSRPRPVHVSTFRCEWHTGHAHFTTR